MQFIFNERPKGKRAVFVIGILAPFFFGVLAYGLYSFTFASPGRDASSDCTQRYSLLRNSMDCMSVEQHKRRNDPLEEDVKSYVDEQVAGGNAKRVSVFFRDLAGHRTFDVYPDERFAPASLLKLPLAIAYLKYSEVNPNILTQELIYRQTVKDLDASEEFKPPSRMVNGEKYNVESLLERMVGYSDNEALALLLQNIDQAFIRKVFADLNMARIDEADGAEDFLSTRTYGSILKKLYNASYLDPDHSQKLLDIMVRSTFSEGLMAGVPNNTIQIANKFGERSHADKDNNEVSVELHDCGIVYRLDHPYVICVMTEGVDYAKLAHVIAGISKIVYEDD